MFKKLIIPMIAVIAAVGLAFGTGDFKKGKLTLDKEAVSTNMGHPFYFKNGSGVLNISDPNAYQDSPTGITCSDGELPCEISVPDIPGKTPAEALVDYLQNTSPEDVVKYAIEKRS